MSQHSVFATATQTPQFEQADPRQVENNAGGYTFEIDKWEALHRFLILGTEGGTYYVGQGRLTRQNTRNLEACIAEDGERVVQEIVAISDSGRASSNDPALFALACAAKIGDAATRKAALDNLGAVARIGTHLFHFASYVEMFGGWGRGTKRAVAKWYDRHPDKLAYQLIKYRQRDGWSHRDLLRLSHPKPSRPLHTELFRWVTQGLENPSHPLIEGYERAQRGEDAVKLIREYNLPREALPTEALNDPEVWRAMLDMGMPFTALIRNLGNMTKLGLLTGLSATTQQVVEQLSDGEGIRKARVHPLAVLTALKTYRQGHGMRGSSTWQAVPQIVDVLDAAFYEAFDNVEPTGKTIFIGLDVSSSMGWGNIAGSPLTPREAAAAMCLVTARVESRYVVAGFSHNLVQIPLSGRERLDDVLHFIDGMPFGQTDCALPMLAAIEDQLQVDAFLIYTDNETWCGHIHPHEALREYRRKHTPDAKLGVIGMTATKFSIADPSDTGMLDVVGFDTATPSILSDFIGQHKP